MIACSQWHYCGCASECQDCPSRHKNPLLYTSVLLPSGKHRKIKLSLPPAGQFDLFGGEL